MIVQQAMRALALAAAAIAALALPAAATADYQPADSYPQLGQVLPIARDAWPGSPCQDRELIQFDPAPFISPLDGSRPIGLAWEDGTCRVDLEDSLLGQPVLLCWVVTHEFGHLAGYDHSTDPNNVMYPGGHYDPCDVLAPPPPAPAVAPALTPAPAPTVAVKHAKHKKKHTKKCRQKSHKARRACEHRRARARR